MCSGVHWESILKIGLFISNKAGDKKSSRRRSLFGGSKSPERDIDNLTSFTAPRQLYESTFKNTNAKKSVICQQKNINT